MNPHIATMKQQLNTQQLMAFQSEAVRYRKEPVVAFLLAFFLGIFGAHHFYLGRTRPGTIMLICTPCAVAAASQVVTRRSAVARLMVV